MLKRIGFPRVLRTLCVLLCVCAMCVLLVSCGVGWDSFMSSIGFDTRDYASEAVTKTYSTDGELAVELAQSVRMLTLNTPSLPEFSAPGEAADLFRDTVLNYMLVTNYSRYTGDIEALDASSEAYPTMQVTNIIPASEFEQTYYKFFGGAAKITNKSGEYFLYLSKLESYTALSSPRQEEISVKVLSLEETENTYRLRVNLTLGENTSPAYDILLIKRDDATYYFKSVRLAGQDN